MKLVVAWCKGFECNGYGCVENTHLLCAERRLVVAALRRASQLGVPRWRVGAWVASKLKTIHVDRHLADGTRGCSLPCRYCRRALDVFDPKVVCGDMNGDAVCGRCRDFPPTTKETRGRRYLKCV